MLTDGTGVDRVRLRKNSEKLGLFTTHETFGFVYRSFLYFPLSFFALSSEAGIVIFLYFTIPFCIPVCLAPAYKSQDSEKRVLRIRSSSHSYIWLPSATSSHTRTHFVSLYCLRTYSDAFDGSWPLSAWWITTTFLQCLFSKDTACLRLV